VFDENINKLVVIANESYEDFAKSLQNEYEEDCGVTFGKVPMLAFVKLERLEGEETKPIGRTGSEAIWNALKANLDLVLYVSSTFKGKVSKFGTFVPTPTDTTVIRRFNNNSADKKIHQVIDTYTGDCGTARLELHPYLRQDSAQKAEALGVDYRYMSLRVRKAPMATELKPEGSGRRGTTEQTFGLQAIPTYFAQYRRND
jgi:hypothetical protein